MSKYFCKIGHSELYNVYREQYDEHIDIRVFAQNPFQLSMLLYLIESDPQCCAELKNIYSLYSAFFDQWMKKEKNRRTGAKKKTEEIFDELWTIARNLYDNKNTMITSNDTAILGLLITKPEEGGKKYVSMFYHRSFMEFLLARGVIEAMKKGADALIGKVRKNNRSDVDKLVKAGFDILSYEVKNQMVRNMIEAIQQSKEMDSPLTEDECFYVENQLLYYMTRMKGMNPTPVADFIKKIYGEENRTIMRQSIAYGAANLGIFDIALEFARRMEPGSEEDKVNRAWTLVFYGDMPEEDPLHYVDDNVAPWKRSREARLRRFQKNTVKDRAFRMFDLRIMYGFFESRGWQGLSSEELSIIKECETDIPGYPQEVVEFLRWAKEVLVDEYEKHLGE